MNVQGKVWGVTTSLFNKNNVEVHFIRANKGGYCSVHLHKAKFNKFIVLTGKLKITTWKDYGTETLEDISIITAGQECTVAPGDYHQFEALEDTQALEVYWVELNDHDIVRKDHGGVRKDETKTNECNESRGYTERKSYLFSKNWNKCESGSNTQESIPT